MQLEVSSEYIELAQALKLSNLFQSGGQAKYAIQQGEVRLNGEVETRRGRKLRPGDRVTYAQQEIEITAAAANSAKSEPIE